MMGTRMKETKVMNEQQMEAEDEGLDGFRLGDRMKIRGTVYTVTDFWIVPATFYVRNPTRVRFPAIRACRLVNDSGERATFTTDWLNEHAMHVRTERRK